MGQGGADRGGAAGVIRSTGAYPRTHGSVAPRTGRFRTIQAVLSTWRPTSGILCTSDATEVPGMPTVMSRMETSRLVLRNDLAELNRLARWIEEWAGQIVPPDTSFALQLCLEETVANIIMHEMVAEDQSEIAIELERDGETLRALVEDCGRRFDPT